MHWDAVGCHGVISRTPCQVKALTKVARVLLHRILKSMFQIALSKLISVAVMLQNKKAIQNSTASHPVHRNSATLRLIKK